VVRFKRAARAGKHRHLQLVALRGYGFCELVNHPLQASVGWDILHGQATMHTHSRTRAWARTTSIRAASGGMVKEVFSASSTVSPRLLEACDRSRQPSSDPPQHRQGTHRGVADGQRRDAARKDRAAFGRRGDGEGYVDDRGGVRQTRHCPLSAATHLTDRRV
jgi:hypothetical protein